jgi:DNA-binding NarL/FixJ family response regulator
LIDVTMPDFDPIATVRRICADYPELKVLIISAYDDAVYVRGLLAAGAHGYHLKDQPLSDLALAVRRVLDGERWISGPLVDKLVNPQPAGTTGPCFSVRQRDILELLQQGLTNQEIADALNLSAKTIENHLTRLYRRLGVRNRLEAIAYVIRQPAHLAVAGTSLIQDEEAMAAYNACVSLLLVDDNARYRNRLRHMVARAHAQTEIYEAGSIQNAVRLVQSAIIHLALIDVVLGDESGIQCVRRLHAVSPATRIVLISAYPDQEFHRSGLQAGACAFLDKKDLDISSLRHIIQDIVVG